MGSCGRVYGGGWYVIEWCGGWKEWCGRERSGGGGLCECESRGMSGE